MKTNDMKEGRAAKIWEYLYLYVIIPFLLGYIIDHI